MARRIVQHDPIYTRPVLEVGNGVCATGHPLSAQAGIRVMRAGGNAFDALVAAAFTTFVMEPESCGLGGYGHISAYIASERSFLSIDAYCRAPGEASADMFETDNTRALTYYGHPFTKGDKAYCGPLAIAVPGAVVGFCDTHEMLGKLPLSKVLEPAIEAAQAGVPVTFKHQLAIAENLDDIKRFPDTASALLSQGRVPAAQTPEGGGDRLDTGALARFLKQIAKRGKRAFQQGVMAQRIVQYVRANGGILSVEDLAGYRPRVLREHVMRYRGSRYVSCFDHVAYEVLSILEHFDLGALGPNSYAYRHLTAEALAIAFTDNMTHYGDPDFERAPIGGLTSAGFAKLRRKLIRMNRALPRPVAAGDPWPFDNAANAAQRLPGASTLARISGTSQIAVADRFGNTASACISIGSNYGSLIYVPEAGIFMNNAMQNFDPRPQHPSHIEPGKMPIFAAPALVAAHGSEAIFASSGSGGYRIEPGVLQTFMNYLDHRMPVQEAVDHPRVHCQGGPTYADSRIAPAVLGRLQRAGHDLVVLDSTPGANPFGRICAVAREPESKTLSASANPPWATGVAGY